MADISKTQKMGGQACGSGILHTLLQKCIESEISVQQKRFIIVKSFEEKYNMQKQVMNFHNFDKAVILRIVLRCFMK
jgi:hypothetical protein